MHDLRRDEHHLFPPPTRLLGRERELEAIQRLLLCPEVRLLTLTGPAGVGKTRLALEAGVQVAGSFPQGIAFVDLTPVRDPGLVLSSVAQGIGLQDVGGGPLLDRLRAYLQDRTALLILDNFEQVLPAAAQLVELLATCPGITFLVTSRSPLHLQWEQTMLVSPLPMPDLDRLPSPGELAEIPSVALFLQRADLILVDPFGGGWDASLTTLWALRQNPETKQIPLIVCTGNIAELFFRQGSLRVLGASILQKPFTEVQLLEMVRASLSHPGA